MLKFTYKPRVFYHFIIGGMNLTNTYYRFIIRFPMGLQHGIKVPYMVRSFMVESLEVRSFVMESFVVRSFVVESLEVRSFVMESFVVRLYVSISSLWVSSSAI